MAQKRDRFIPGPAGALAVRARVLPDRPMVVLVHGARLSGVTAFDFSFPGGQDYSLLDWLAAHHLGAVTFAIPGLWPFYPAGRPAYGRHRGCAGRPGCRHCLAQRWTGQHPRSSERLALRWSDRWPLCCALAGTGRPAGLARPSPGWRTAGGNRAAGALTSHCGKRERSATGAGVHGGSRLPGACRPYRPL